MSNPIHVVLPVFPSLLQQTPIPLNHNHYFLAHWCSWISTLHSFNTFIQLWTYITTFIHRKGLYNPPDFQSYPTQDGIQADGPDAGDVHGSHPATTAKTRVQAHADQQEVLLAVPFRGLLGPCCSIPCVGTHWISWPTRHCAASQVLSRHRGRVHQIC